jgi:hypothetical protein
MQLMFRADPVDETCVIYSKSRPYFRLVLSREDLIRMDQARGFAVSPAVKAIHQKEQSNARNPHQPTRSTDRS